jgi:hypothetical protein
VYKVGDEGGDRYLTAVVRKSLSEASSHGLIVDKNSGM